MVAISPMASWVTRANTCAVCPSTAVVNTTHSRRVRRAYGIRIGSERGDNRVATGDACQRQRGGEGNILCEGRWVVSQQGADQRALADLCCGHVILLIN